MNWTDWTLIAIWTFWGASICFDVWKRWRLPKERLHTIELSMLENIPPGGVHVWEDRKTGNKWCVMHYDDFEHLIDTGNRFRLIDPPKQPSTVEASRE